MLGQFFFNKMCYKNGHIFGELYVSEGIKEIKNCCFESLIYIDTYYFPKTLGRLHRYSYIKDYIKVVKLPTNDKH